MHHAAVRLISALLSRRYIQSIHTEDKLGRGVYRISYWMGPTWRPISSTNTQQTWRQEFLGSRSSTVERPFTRTAAAGTFLRFFQTIFENTSLWRPKRLVTLSTYRRYINKCIYLSNLAPRMLILIILFTMIKT